MVVTGISDGMTYFTSSINEIEVSQIVGDNLKIRILNMGMELFNENYTPMDGKVSLYNLGDMLRDNIKYEVPEGMSRTLDRYTASHFPVQVYLMDNQNQFPISFTLFYCRCHTSVSPLAPVFFTHEKTIRTAADRMEHLTAYAGDTNTYIEVGVAYLSGSLEKYKTYRQSMTHPYLGCYNLSIKEVAKKANVALSSILYYEAILKVDGVQKDKVRFIHDQRRYRNVTRFIYTNAFGLPETATFTGLDEFAPELEGNIMELLRGSARPESRFIDVHTVNSGYVDAARYRKLLDLITSPSIFIYDGERMDEVVITDIDFTHKRIGNEMINVSLTYRKAGRNHLGFDRTVVTRTRIFDSTFDNSFN